jgi:hypothetical protein
MWVDCTFWCCKARYGASGGSDKASIKSLAKIGDGIVLTVAEK